MLNKLQTLLSKEYRSNALLLEMLVKVARDVKADRPPCHKPNDTVPSVVRNLNYSLGILSIGTSGGKTSVKAILENQNLHEPAEKWGTSSNRWARRGFDCMQTGFRATKMSAVELIVALRTNKRVLALAPDVLGNEYETKE